MAIESISAVDVIFGTGGFVGVFLVAKEIFKKFVAGKNMETVEFEARADILGDLRTEIKTLRERVDTLENRVAKLTDRLVKVRSHALLAHNLVMVHCKEVPQQQDILAVITEIIQED